MNSDHAPTAEEQLSPAREACVVCAGTGKRQRRSFADGDATITETCFQCHGKGNVLRPSDELEAQLLAALREVEKARGDVEGLRKILQSTEDAWRSQEKQLAEKDAKITQLAQLVERMAETSHGYFQRADAASAKLCAVSDALEERERLLRRLIRCSEQDADLCTLDEHVREIASEAKAELARIRAIVEGK